MTRWGVLRVAVKLSRLPQLDQRIAGVIRFSFDSRRRGVAGKSRVTAGDQQRKAAGAAWILAAAQLPRSLSA